MQRLLPVIVMLFWGMGTLLFDGCKKETQATAPTPPGSTTSTPDTLPKPAIVPSMAITASPSTRITVADRAPGIIAATDIEALQKPSMTGWSTLFSSPTTRPD